MKKETVYNPLDKTNLGISVAEAMLSTELHGLDDLTPFQGAGIYAIYYHGPYLPYSNIRSSKGKQEIPIYVGKAVPAGARKGNVGLGKDAGTVLFKRLREHADSIRTTTLELSDFTCRYLVVDDIWIPLGEALLITRFSPLWNKLIDGFGNHDPGAGRHAGMRPRWDTLHPGRKWALRLKDRSESLKQIERDVIEHLKTLK